MSVKPTLIAFSLLAAIMAHLPT